MKSAFPSFYRLSSQDFRKLWANGLIVFDTNVLLNLYRYQASTSDSLLKVMYEVSDRLWIPHHVGLEFQRRRLSVISEQNKRYSEVRNVVQKSISNLIGQLNDLKLEKRHTHIDPKSFIHSIERSQEGFMKQLDKHEQSCISVTGEDPFRQQLDELFDGKLGNPPASQKELDKLFEEGKTRYSKRVPPGFEDSGKAETSANSFVHDGLSYKAEYGDLLIWRQLLDYASKAGTENIIFVTDDTKSDWWHKVQDRGEKTIGPRPELREEICAIEAVTRFHMYTTETFLKHANEYIESGVSNDALMDVRQLRRSQLTHSKSSWIREYDAAETAIYDWLKKRFQTVMGNYHGLCKFECNSANDFVGVEVHVLHWPPGNPESLLKYMRSSRAMMEQAGYSKVIFIIAFFGNTQNALLDFPDSLAEHVASVGLSNKLTFLTGSVEFRPDGLPELLNVQAVEY